jgi:hypothetical protein
MNLSSAYEGILRVKYRCCDWDDLDSCFEYLYSLVKDEMGRGEKPDIDPFSIFMYNFTPE